MAGAKQWRVKCPHVDDRPAETAMASEVSQNNKGYWAREGRVPDGVDAKQLGQILEDASGTIVVCNACRRVLELDGSAIDVKVDADPYCETFSYPGDPHGDAWS